MANKLRVTTKDRDEFFFDKIDLLESFCMKRGYGLRIGDAIIIIMMCIFDFDLEKFC